MQEQQHLSITQLSKILPYDESINDFIINKAQMIQGQPLPDIKETSHEAKGIAYTKRSVQIPRWHILGIMAQICMGWNDTMHIDQLLFQYRQLPLEKLKCLLHYFSESKRLSSNQAYMNEIVTITQSALDSKSEDFGANNKLCKIQFISGGVENHQNAIYVNFADRFLTALTLDAINCAQEEVLMLLYPEALVSKLFFPLQKNNQAVIIENLYRFNDYKGYQKSFQWVYREARNLNQCMLAIDAKQFYDHSEQFQEDNKQFDLTKALIGYILTKGQVVSTGKWGCGIFRGDPYLKTLIQWWAASVSGTEKVIFNGFTDKQYIQDMQKECETLKNKTAGQLLEIITNKGQ